MSPPRPSFYFAIIISALTVRCGWEEPNLKPLVETGTVSDLTFYGAAVSAKVLDDKGHPLITRGVCWGTLPDPMPGSKKLEAGSAMGEFTTQLKGLTPGTTYFVRAFAINDAGLSLGESTSFTTKPNPFPGRWTVISRTQTGCDLRDNIEMMPDGLPNGTTGACCVTMEFTGTTIYIDGFNSAPGQYRYNFMSDSSSNVSYCLDGKCMTYVELELCSPSMGCNRSYFAIDDGKLRQLFFRYTYPNGNQCTTLYVYKK